MTLQTPKLSLMIREFVTIATHFMRTYCNWHTDEKGHNELKSIIAKIKKEGEGKDFDCLMGMVRIDSSYLLYVMKEKYGLRPLVFHVDAGWNSQIAVNNIERLIDGLGLDLYTEVINWEEIKDLQLSFFKSEFLILTPSRPCLFCYNV